MVQMDCKCKNCGQINKKEHTAHTNKCPNCGFTTSYMVIPPLGGIR
jgi:DNA-directed RNA polymerase subunit RPC12/RpoP